MFESWKEREALTDVVAERANELAVGLSSWRMGVRTCLLVLAAGAVLTALTWLLGGELYLPE